MEDITNSELYRAIQDIRQSDKEYREGEKNKLEKIEIKLERIEMQTTKTNGRVTRLEEDGRDRDAQIIEVKKDIGMFKMNKSTILGGAAVVLFLQGIIFFAAGMWVKNMITEQLNLRDEKNAVTQEEKIKDVVRQAFDDFTNDYE